MQSALAQARWGVQARGVGGTRSAGPGGVGVGGAGPTCHGATCEYVREDLAVPCYAYALCLYGTCLRDALWVACKCSIEKLPRCRRRAPQPTSDVATL